MFTSVTPHPVTPVDGMERGWLARLWYQLGPGSTERHAQARIEAKRLAVLRYDWQQACQHVGLGLTIHTPSGVTVSVPRIARADFGPPVSFTVWLRPGQRASDVRAAAPRLALAFGVAGLRVTEREAGWVNVVVLDPRAGSPCGDADVQDGRSDDPPRAPELHVA